ncbi:hypothetical protein [Amycolatopsis cihanbeyliensis]|uniref:Mce-associated membrane protein n=1 Tax=Amycolatopsis cihanbeyliensis TaxID=1128664 RepID=A0A542DMC0_AMYCI|nr:hypothetical protein [Amycolatopsis cihanbeyliensis]TQJ04240.1 Mce-associated membrane protein [Amycolatopsis cihanbeyliensis]
MTSTAEPTETTDAEVPGEEREPVRTRRRPRPGTILALVLVVASLGYAGWFGVSWWRAAEQAGGYAQARDEVLRVGEQGVTNLTTMDHTRFEEGMSRWRDSATGALRDSLVQDAQRTRERITGAKTSTRGKVVDAAVTELDQRAGAATVIAAAEITVTREGAEPAVRRNRFRVELSRTDDGWKLSALSAVGVGGE